MQYNINKNEFTGIFKLLQQKGYTVIAPSVENKAIVYKEIEDISDLPIGWTDEQTNGKYKLKKRSDKALFGYNCSPQTWKKFFFPPKENIAYISVTPDGGFESKPYIAPFKKYAIIGMKSCEIHALAIQDKVFLNGPHKDHNYEIRRKDVFIIAANCTQAGGTCFCTSMNTGPKASFGYDLALTEVINSEQHYFVLDTGSNSGTNIIKDFNFKIAQEKEQKEANDLIEKTKNSMPKKMDTNGIKELLYKNMENVIWDDVAQRCLSCGNCTMSCPTCFCSSNENVTDLSGKNSKIEKKWDSCFNQDFSYISGGPVRSSVKSRYRQWITHKLATWFDQFGSSGCVGCGRCITWCPTGIDITEEIGKLQKQDKKG